MFISGCSFKEYGKGDEGSALERVTIWLGTLSILFTNIYPTRISQDFARFFYLRLVGGVDKLYDADEILWLPSKDADGYTFVECIYYTWICVSFNGLRTPFA